MLNLQHRLANSFDSGDAHSVCVSNAAHGVGLRTAQTPYHEETAKTPPVDPYPEWMTFALHVLFPLIVLMVMLVVLCGLARRHSQARAPTALGEAIAIYRQAIRTAPAFLWVSFLQLPSAGGSLRDFFSIPLMLLHILFFGSLAIDPYVKFPLLIPGLLIDIVLHFLQNRAGLRWDS